jgi:hypothetical protein
MGLVEIDKLVQINILIIIIKKKRFGLVINFMSQHTSWLSGAHSIVGFGCSRQQDLSSVVRTIIRHMKAVNLRLETTTPKRFFYG